MKKRMISMLLSVLMILSLVPVSIQATSIREGVVLEKKLESPLPDENGHYTLVMTVTGEQIESIIGKTAGDIVLVIDNSGSMSDRVGGGTCDKTGAEILEVEPETETIRKWNKVYTVKVYTCPDCGHRYTEYYSEDDEEPYYSDLPAADSECGLRIQGKTRLEIAQAAAKQFADYVLEEAPESRIGVIGFAGSIGGLNDWTAIKRLSPLTGNPYIINSAIDSMFAYGGTNYTAALDAAHTMLDNRSSREIEKRPGYVIFLTDGAPGKRGDSIGNSRWDGSEQADSIKEDPNGYTLYAIGLLLDEEKESGAITHLESLATSPAEMHFVNLSDENDLETRLSEVLKQWAGENFSCAAGTDAVLTDTVSEYFEIVEAEGAEIDEETQTVTWEIGDLREKQEFRITIQPKDGLHGTLPTNDECKLTYTDPKGCDKTKCAPSPTIDFVALHVTKVWKDALEEHPEVTVTLLADGVPTDRTIVLNDENDWEDGFYSLPRYTSYGAARCVIPGEYREIEYTLSETPVDGYTSEIVVPCLPDCEGIYCCTIINTPDDTPCEKTEISISKVWDDDNDRDGLRPDSVTVLLLANGFDTGKSAELSEENDWYAEFTCLPKHTAGCEIQYTVAEIAADGYVTEITGDAAAGFTVTNTHIPAQYDEDDNDGDGNDSLTVIKIWDDEDDNDGVRPESITVSLMNGDETIETITLTAADGWTGTFRDVPVYEDGKVIAYTVKEETDTVYEAKIEINKKDDSDFIDSFTITNTYEILADNTVKVTKVWDDENDQDGLRPDSIEVVLMNGEETVAEAVLGDSNDWTYVFTDLPVYEDGQPLLYTVEEAEVPAGYTKVVAGDAVNGFVITNTHIPADYDDEDDEDGYAPITVAKRWTDDNAEDAYQPAAVTAELFKVVKTENGEEYISVDEVTLNEKNDWKASFGSQPVFENGEKIVYTVKESEVSGYTAEVSLDEDENSLVFTLDNTFTGDVADLTITKEITGNASSKKDLFTFKVVFDDAKAELEIPADGLHYSGTLDGREKISGKLASGDTFQMKGDGSITIKGVPVGTHYTVTETRTLGYTVRAYNASGRLEEDCTAEFVNKKTDNDPFIPPFIPPVIPDPDEPDDPIRPVIPEIPEKLNTEDHYAYIIGYPDGTVRPEREITRAEVATIFFRMLTDEAREYYWSTSNDFTDVAEGDWYNNAISTLTNVGVINGYPDGTFRPNASITRAEIVKIAVSFFEFVEENDRLFSDVEGHWAEAYIAAAAEKGLVNGYPDGSFKPDRNVTRAEAVTIINNVLGRKPCKDRLLDEMIFWPDNADEDMWYYEAIQEATNSHEYIWEDLREKLCEQWTRLLPVRDWATLERAWAANMAPNPGEVMNNP